MLNIVNAFKVLVFAGNYWMHCSTSVTGNNHLGLWREKTPGNWVNFSVPCALLHVCQKKWNNLAHRLQQWYWVRTAVNLLSGTRTSRGTGMVGLLSFRSTMITVRVAEPANRGVPLSVAVITKLKKKVESLNSFKGGISAQNSTAHSHCLL